jgi:UMF1 family MFS transporter
MNKTTRSIYAWAFYDWANSAFAVIVIAGFFPVFFKQYWSGGVEDNVSTLRLGMANSLSSAVVVLLAPLMGAIADQSGTRQRFLLLFAVLGAATTAGLYWVEQGAWELAVLVYAAAAVSFSMSNTFYDSLLSDVAPPERTDAVSGLGYGLGYLGGGLIFSLHLYAVIHPDFFGFESAGAAVRFSFISVAVWWITFSIPVLLFVKENKPTNAPGGLAAIASGYKQLKETVSHIRQLPQTVYFLVAYWLYIDGLDTIVRMAVDYGMSLGFGHESLLTALLITQFVGFPFAIVFSRMSVHLGTRNSLFVGLAVYSAATIWGYFISEVWEFYGLAVLVGFVQGGVQALSRSMYTRLIPHNKRAEFFGFYNMLGKFATLFGPILMGWTSILFESTRMSILSILLLFIGGAFFLAKVDITEGERAAAAFGDDANT